MNFATTAAVRAFLVQNFDSALAGKTRAGANVFHYRASSFPDGALPGLNIVPVDLEDEIDPNNKRALILAVVGVLALPTVRAPESGVAVSVEAVRTAQNAAAVELNAFAGEIEAAVAAAPSCMGRKLVRTQYEVDPDGHVPLGRVRLFYRFTLYDSF